MFDHLRRRAAHGSDGQGPEAAPAARRQRRGALRSSTSLSGAGLGAAGGAAGGSELGRRVHFEPVEARLLLSADLNPALGAGAAADADLELAETLAVEQAVDASAALLDMELSAAAAGAAPDLSGFVLGLGAQEDDGGFGGQAYTYLHELALSAAAPDAEAGLTLAAGETVTLARSETGDLEAALELRGPDGAAVLRLAPGEALSAAFRVETAGVYAWAGEWVSGEGVLQAAASVGAALEAEAMGIGAGEVQAMDPSALDLGAPDLGASETETPAIRYAAIGAVQAGDADLWSFEAGAGELATITLAGRSEDFAAAGLALLRADGTVLAQAAAEPDGRLALRDVEIRPEDAGRLVLSVTGHGLYTLVALRGAQAMSYDGGHEIDLTGRGPVLGGLQGVSPIGVPEGHVALTEEDDLYETATLVDMPAGEDGTWRAAGEIGGVGTLLGAADRDMIAVELGVGDRLEVKIRAEREGSALDAFLRIFGPDGWVDETVDDVAGLDPELSFVAWEAGTYHIGVSGAGNSAYWPTAASAGADGSMGEYLIEVSVARPERIEGAAVESDDLRADATHIDLPAEGVSIVSMTGEIGESGAALGFADRDLFTIDLVDGDELDIQVYASSRISSGLDSYLMVFQPDGELWDWNDDYWDYDSAISMTADMTGTWTIGVSGYGNDDYTVDDAASGSDGSTGVYRLEVVASRVAPDPLSALALEVTAGENDDLATSASVLPLFAATYAQVSVSGSIDNSVLGTLGDRDVFRVDLAKGDRITANLANDGSQIGRTVMLFDADGERVTYDFSTKADTSDAWYSYSIRETGTYYVGVSGFSTTSYSLYWDPFDITSRAYSNGQGDYKLTVTVSRDQPNDDFAFYALDVNAGDEVVVSAQTPGVGARGEDLVVDMAVIGPDARIVTQAAGGTVSFIAAETATYVVRLAAASGGGGYVLRASGSTATRSAAAAAGAPQVVSVTAGDFALEEGDATLGATAPQWIDVTFDAALYGGALDPAMLTVGGAAAHGVALTAEGALRFDIAGMIAADGLHEIALDLGRIESLAGVAGAGTLLRSFALDATAPVPVSVEDAAGGAPGPGAQTLRLSFSEEVAYFYNTSAFSVTDRDTGAAISVSSMRRPTGGDATAFELTLSTPLAEGNYRLLIAPEWVSDVIGNPVAVDGIDFAVDAGTRDLGAEMIAASPFGYFTYDGSLEGALHGAGDVDVFGFELGAAAPVSFWLEAGTGALLRLKDASGATVWEGAAADGAAVFGSDGDLGAGAWTVEVEGVEDAGRYRLTARQGAALEAETAGGAANDAEAQALSFAAVEGGAAATAAGRIGGADAVDLYRISLDAPGLLSFHLGGAIEGLTAVLIDPSGGARAAAAVQFDGAGAASIPAEAGEWLLRIEAGPEAQAGQVYTLGVLRDVRPAAEPTADAALRIAGDGVIQGGLGAGLGGARPIRVAVVWDGSSSGYAQLAAQLQDSATWAIETALVTGLQVDTLEKLSAYDVVVTGNPGSTYYNERFSAYGAALAEWVTAGGALVMTGYGLIGFDNENDATKAAWDSVLPVDVFGGDGRSSAAYTVGGVDHPILDGVGAGVNLGYAEYARGGLNDGAILLAGTLARPSAAAMEVGAGRSVYLGRGYMASSTSYRAGNDDLLLEQALSWAVGGSDAEDAYTLELEAGATLVVTVAGDAGLEALTARLLDGDGVEIAAAVADETGVLTLTHAAAAAGSYRLELSAAPGGGHYRMEVSGVATTTGDAAVVRSSLPADGGTVAGAPEALEIAFSGAIDLRSVSAGDLSIDGGATVAGVEVIGGATLRFLLDMPQESATYSWSLAEGAVLDASGLAAGGAAGVFTTDLDAPKLVSVEWSDPADGYLDAVTLTFDQEIASGGFTAADVIAFTDPQGRDLRGQIWDAWGSGASLTINFNQQFAGGDYALTLSGALTDLSGNGLIDPETGAPGDVTARFRTIMPDLVVTAFTAPDHAYFGEIVPVEITIVNMGEDPAPIGWNDVLYLSPNGTANGTTRLSWLYPEQDSDLPLDATSLAPGESYTYRLNAAIPESGLAEGDLWIGVTLDNSWDVFEADGSSGDNAANVFTRPITLEYPELPDLAVSDLTVTPFIGDALEFGGAATVSFTVTNVGAYEAVGIWEDRLHIARSASGSALHLFERTSPGLDADPETGAMRLAAGQSYVVSMRIELPDDLPYGEGAYRFVLRSDVFDGVLEYDEALEDDDSNNSADVSVQIVYPPQPDFAVTAVATPADAVAGEEIEIAWTVSNLGLGAPFESYRSFVYLSADSAYGSSDIEIGSFIGNELDPGTSVEFTRTVTLPDEIAGDYHLIVRTNVGLYASPEDGSSANNTAASAARFRVAAKPFPDVVVTALSHPGAAVAGGTITVTGEIANIGDADVAEDWGATFYLISDLETGLDPSMHAYNVPIALTDVPGPLAAGESMPFELELRIPDSYLGDYYLAMSAAYGGAGESEAGEGNNVRVSETGIRIVEALYPDLYGRDLAVPADALAEEEITVGWTVVNGGDAALEGSWTETVWLVDPTGVAGPVQLGAHYADQELLEIDGAVARSLDVTLPRLLRGDFLIRVVLDSADRIEELLENDNILTAASPTSVTMPPTPDLRIAAVRGPGSVLSGETIAVEWDVANAGDAAAAGAWTDRLELVPADPARETVSLGRFDHAGAIAAGETITRRQTVTLPIWLEGAYTLRVVADIEDALFEGFEEENNAGLADAPMQAILRLFPNLAVSAVSAPEQAWSGGEATIEWTVANIGDAPTDADFWYDRVVLSVDDVAGNADDWTLGRVLNGAFLNPGESYTNRVTGRLPLGVEQTYTVFVIADHGDRVEEYLGESDNVGGDPMFVGLSPWPDLAVHDVAAAALAYSGTETPVSWTVTNMGETVTGADAWTDRIWLSEDAVLDGEDVELASIAHVGALEAGESYSVSSMVELPEGIRGTRYILVQSDAGGAVYEFAFKENNIGVDLDDLDQPDATEVLLTPPPDLEISVVSIPAETVAGQEASLTVSVANVGATDMERSTITFEIWLLGDPELEEEDERLAAVNVHRALAVGASFAQQMAFTLPAAAVGGRSLAIRVNEDLKVFELETANNAVEAQLTALRVTPDLQADHLIAPATAVSGDEILIHYGATNIGAGRTYEGGWRDRLTLSRDSILGDGDDIFVTEIYRGMAMAGMSYTRENIAWQLPGGLSAGTWTLFLELDVAGTQFEDGARENNVISTVIEVVDDRPDLTATGLVFSGPQGAAAVDAGRNVTLDYTVVNQGVARTGNSTWFEEIWLSLDDVLDEDDIRIRRIQNVEGMNAGDTVARSVSAHVPVDAPAGTYRVILRIDAEDDVDEGEDRAREENGTVLLAGTVSVAAYANGTIDLPADGHDPYKALSPDMVVSDVIAAAEAVSGTATAVSWTVTNMGPHTTGPQGWYDAVYLSNDRIFDAQTDILLGSRRHQPVWLGVEESYSVSATVEIPAGLSGEWYLIVVADARGDVNEADPYNNAALAPQRIALSLPQPADFVVGTVTAPVQSAPGRIETISYSVLNQGPGTAVGAWSDRLYLSVDETWDSQDVAIGVVDHEGPVAMGESYEGSLSFEMPGMLPGDYHVIVRSDVRNAIPEPDETDNAGAEGPVALDIEELALGQSVGATLNAGGSIWYRMTAAEGETLRLSVDRAAAEGATEIYVARGRPPTAADHDAASRVPFEPDATLIVPPLAGEGQVYIWIRSTSGAGGAATISSEILPFAVLEADAAEISDAGRSTLRISGARFEEGMRFALRAADGVEVFAESVLTTDSLTAYATFTMPNAGLNDIVAYTADGIAAELVGAVAVVEDGAGASVETTLYGPSVVRGGENVRVQVSYFNSGGLDAAPALVLVWSGNENPLGLGASDRDYDRAHIIAADADGPVGLLRPGGGSSVTVFTAAIAPDPSVPDRMLPAELELHSMVVTEDNEVPMDWEEIEPEIRPEEIPDAEWAIYWARLTTYIGDTWGDYVRFLNRAQEVAAVPGEPIRDVRVLLTTLFEERPTWLPNVALSGSLSVAATGTAAKQAVEGAYLVAERIDGAAGGGAAEAYSSATGEFAFQDLAPGTWRISLPAANGAADGSGWYLMFDLDGDGEADATEVEVVIAPDDPEPRLDLNVAYFFPEAAEVDRTAPLLATDSAGRLHMVWAENGVWKHAYDAGDGWTETGELALGESAGDVNFTIAPNLIDGMVEGLLLVWTEGLNEAAEVMRAVGRRAADGSYVWSDPEATTSDGYRDYALAAGVDSTGTAQYLYQKADDADEDADSDIYAYTDDLSGLEFDYAAAAQDIAAALGYEGLDSVSLETLSSGRLRIAFVLIDTARDGHENFRTGPKTKDGTPLDIKLEIRIDATPALSGDTFSLTGTVAANLEAGLGSSVEFEARHGFGISWTYNRETCEWEFSDGSLKLTRIVAANIALDDILRVGKLMKLGKASGAASDAAEAVADSAKKGWLSSIYEGLRDILGLKLAAEVGLQLKFAYTDVGQFPFSPSDGRIDLALVGGINTLYSLQKVPKEGGGQINNKTAHFFLRVSGAWSWDKNFDYIDEEDSGVGLYFTFRKKENNYGAGKRPKWMDFTYGGSDILGVNATDAAEAQEYSFTIYETDPAPGSMLDLSGDGETAVTATLTDESAPVMARDAEGHLSAVWINQDGIVLSRFDETLGLWLTPELVHAHVEEESIGDLSLRFDAAGNAMVAWNSMDASLIHAGMSYDAYVAAMDAGGDLHYAFRAAATGQWSAAQRLAATAGDDVGVQMTELPEGGIAAVWRVAGTTESMLSEIHAAIWDAQSGTWSAPVVVGSGLIDGVPALALRNGTAVAVWSQADHLIDEESGATLRSGDYTLRTVALEGGLWNGAEVIETDLDQAVAPQAVQDPYNSAQQVRDFFDEMERLLEEDAARRSAENPECADADSKQLVAAVQKLRSYLPTTVISVDPNDILGPVGFGEENWVAADAVQDYTIRFENEAGASAPAKTVVITQQLDADLDWNSVRIGDFGWGDFYFQVEERLPYFTRRFDFTASEGIYVDVIGGIDVTTGVLSMTLAAVDPATGDSPTDPFLGFLPVNDGTGIGEGFISYTVAARADAGTGARIDGLARIFFDANLPIDTPAIFNTLDADAPVSAMAAAPAKVDGGSVALSWSAADVAGGSGLASVDVMVSENGGAWEVWLDDTTLTGSTFFGEEGAVYAFYVVAADNAGNIEAAPAEAEVTVAMGAQFGTLSGAVFADLDANGTWDAEEDGLEGAVVFLDADGDGALDDDETFDVTDPDGVWTLIGLAPGSYEVTVLRPDDHAATTPLIVAAEVGDGEDAAAAPTGFFALGAVSGVVFEDGIGSIAGVQDGAEDGLAGWTVFLDADGDGARDAGERTSVTDALGRWSFAEIGPEGAQVALLGREGWSLTAGQDAARHVAVGAGQAVGGVDFGLEAAPAAISGVKFEDLNGDGIRDEGEAGLEGWTIFLDADGDGELDAGELSTVTDAEGAWRFDGLARGAYIVAEAPREGWTQTAPGYDGAAAAAAGLSTAGAAVALETPALGAEEVEAAAAEGAGWADALTGMAAFREDARFAGIDGSRATVVTIDTGIDLDHAFFGADADGDGVADRIVFSWDFAGGDADAGDATGHGSGIAGIIAGEDAVYGGIAPGADIIALKVFEDGGAGYFAYLEQALQWTVLNAEEFGVSVVNLSLGDGGAWTEAVGRYGLGDELAALAEMGVIVIAASGNSYASFDTEGVAYPAADPSVIGVGAVWAGDYGGPWYFSNGATDYTTDADRIASFSQRDDDLLDALAPGARFITADQDGGLQAVQGTSHAAAYLSGVATLAQDLALREIGRTLSAAEFSALLSQSAVFVIDGDDEDDSVPNTGLAFPRVDMLGLAEAILAFEPAPEEPSSPQDGDAGGAGALEVAAGAHVVTLSPGQEAADLRFGGFRNIAVSGVVFDDLDGDGIRGAGEAPVAGAVVWLDRDDDGTLDAEESFTVSGADGSWVLAQVGPGAAAIRVMGPEGETAARAGGGRIAIAPRSGTDLAGLDFGLDMPSLQVASAEIAADGVRIRFSAPIDGSVIAATGDLELLDAAGDAVAGSVILDADGMGLRFAPTAALSAGSYALRLSAGAEGFRGAYGALDGDGDGLGGDDFRAALELASPAPGAGGVLSIGNAARAAGQAMSGAAVTLADAAGLSALVFTIGFDPALLEGAGFAAADLPEGASVAVRLLEAGLLEVSIQFAAPLEAGALELGALTGTVAADAPAGAVQSLDLTVVSATGVAGLTAADGVHAVELPGDLDGDGAWTLDDARAYSKLVFGRETGFEDGRAADLGLVGDLDGDGDVDMRDAMLAFRAATGRFDPLDGAGLLSAAGADFALSSGSGSSVNLGEGGTLTGAGLLGGIGALSAGTGAPEEEDAAPSGALSDGLSGGLSGGLGGGLLLGGGGALTGGSGLLISVPMAPRE